MRMSLRNPWLCMNAKLAFSILAFAFAVEAQSQPVHNETTTAPLVAGFRASRILSNYPHSQFPSPDYWLSVGQRMSQKFPGAAPGGVWIVSLYQDNGVTQMNFPGDGNSYPFIQFIGTDQNDAYLSRFDSAGCNIWLQVEPGAASMDTLITLVLNRYKQHKCVRGFGVDVEWFFANTNPEGRKVTDAEAREWEAKVKSIDASYTLFLKHYAPSWMPPSYRGLILFVDDSQQFPSLNSMVNEFKGWGATFAPNNVAFQFGYPIDSTWWKLYPDPPLAIGAALLSAVPNCVGLFWVDFTIFRVFPPLSVQRSPVSGPLDFELSQNYPNPFNPTTTIRYGLPHKSAVQLRIFNTLGRQVGTLVQGEQEAGYHEVRLDGSGLASGVYFYRLQAGSFLQTRKLLLLK
jgi:hypothetical protein